MNAKLKLILSMFLFGTIGLFVRLIPLPSSLIALIRAAVGTVFLLLVMFVKRQKLDYSAIRSNLIPLIASGAAMGFNWILLFESYRYTTVAVATLCYYFSAVFVVLLSPVILKEKLTPVKAICAMAAMAGMVLVSGVLDGGAAFSPTGVLLGLGAAALYASVVFINKRLQNIGSYDTTISQLAAAAIVLLPYVLLSENVSALSVSPLGLASLATVAIVHTGVAYAMYFSSLKALAAQSVALFSYLDPVVALLLSVFVLGETMTWLGLAGAVVVLGSMIVSELFHQKKG